MTNMNMTVMHGLIDGMMEYVNLDYAKSNIIRCVAPKGTNNTDCITLPFMDLEIYFRVMISEEMTYKVTNDVFTKWKSEKPDITVNTLLDYTNKETYEICPMTEIMRRIMREDNIPEDMIDMMLSGTEETDDMMMVITRKSLMFGASAITRMDILKGLADKYEQDLYVIPSSIHELIVIPKENFSVSEINEMINEVNTEQVEPEEQLSDHVYLFQRELMHIGYGEDETES